MSLYNGGTRTWVIQIEQRNVGNIHFLYTSILEYVIDNIKYYILIKGFCTRYC